MIKLLLISVFLIALAALASCGLWAGRQRASALEVAVSPPKDFPALGFTHAGFEALLTRFVSPAGRVDYHSWHQDAHALRQLDAYLAAVSAYSPATTPARFPTRGDQLAYWVYAYNAWVIKAILSHWPLQSVNDIKAPVELVKGMGFFHTQTIVVGGQRMNLLDLEKKSTAEAFHEPRVHFVLNCGSEGCPVQPTILPVGEKLEPFLAQAACRFVANPENVHIDSAKHEVSLSEIFDWYRDQFIAEVPKHLGSEDQRLMTYIASIAPSSLNLSLRAAKSYRLRFRDYDWTVNKARHGAQPVTAPDAATCPP